MPPEHIWDDSEALSQHWEDVRERWKAGTQAQAAGDTVADMTQNELAREFKEG